MELQVSRVELVLVSYWSRYRIHFLERLQLKQQKKKILFKLSVDNDFIKKILTYCCQTVPEGGSASSDKRIGLTKFSYYIIGISIFLGLRPYTITKKGKSRRGMSSKARIGRKGWRGKNSEERIGNKGWHGN